MQSSCKKLGFAMSVAILGLWLGPSHALGDEITFAASVDQARVSLGERVVLSLSITGARNATQPELPRLQGLRVVSTGTTSQFNFVNGKMFASRSFTYVLIPEKLGQLTIGPAIWEYEGRRYTTQPISLEVVQGGTVPQGSSPPGATLSRAAPVAQQPQLDLGDRLFVQVRTDKTEVYLNEQIILVFRLYRKNLNLDDLQYTPPATVGFIEESLGKQKETRELINGEMYDVIELKTALFPASTGELTIDPASLKCNILVRAREQRSQPRGIFDEFFDESFFRDSFMSRLTRYPVELKSNPLTVRVLPVPELDKPATFQGAVGDYQMEAWIKPTSLKVGEPVNVTMKVVGNGNIATLPEPIVDGLEGFKSYNSESKVHRQERIDAFGGEKIFEKVLIPQKAGKLKIPSINFSFFNPRTRHYETLSEGPFWLDVEESAEGRGSKIVTSGGVSAAKEDVQIQKRDILFIKEGLGSLRSPREEIIQHPFFWWVQTLPLILLLGAVLLKRRSERLGSDVGRMRSRKAYARAKTGFKKAEKMAKGLESGPFYQSLYQSLGEYIADRWNLSSGEITPQDLVGLAGLSEDSAQKTRQLLERINQGRFAGALVDSQSKRGLLEETLVLIKQLERGA